MKSGTNTTIEPILVTEVELSNPIEDIHTDKDQGCYNRVQLLIRIHTIPIGILRIDAEDCQVTAQTLTKVIWENLSAEINKHLRDNGLPEIDHLSVKGIQSTEKPLVLQRREALLADAPSVTVAICTRDHPTSLKKTLDSVLALEYPNYDIVVIDNAPSTEETYKLVNEDYAHVPQIRYFREERKGLSRARNKAHEVAQGSIIVHTDDDVIVDKHWLTAMVEGFSTGENVACVTGLVLPLQLDTPAQVLFEQYSGYIRGLEPQLYDMGPNRPKRPFYPFSAGIFGTGANSAMKLDAVRELGGFDVTLGAGTPTLGGEDLAIFADFILRNWQLAYAPSGLIYHTHRRELSDVRNTMYGYGTGFTAYLTRVFLANPLRIPGFILSFPRGLYLAISAQSAKAKTKEKEYEFPAEFIARQRKGLIAGPWTYFRSRLAQKRARKS